MKRIKIIISKIFGRKPSHYWRYFIDRKYMKKLLNQKITNTRTKPLPLKIAVIFIGTKSYKNFFPRYYESIEEKFLIKTQKDFFVFTDNIHWDYLKNKKNVFPILIKDSKKHFFLRTYDFFLQIEDDLKKYDFVFFMDGDMYINEKISEEEIFCHDKPLTGVHHPNFVKKPGTFEKGTKSLASIKNGADISTYWQFCFVGGEPKEFIKMAEVISKRIKEDLKNNTVALWYDEAHFNKYFIENKNNVYTYNPSYSYPKCRPIPPPFKKKIIHIWEDKNKKKYLLGKEGKY